MTEQTFTSRTVLRGQTATAARRLLGFTMLEVILVIAVGLSLLFSATYVYRVAQDSASAAKAKDKVLALQGVVEDLAAANGNKYPDFFQLAQVWAHKRTDYNVSPWGGVITHGCPDAVGEYPPNPSATMIPGIAGQAAGAANVSGGFVECGYQNLQANPSLNPAPTPFPTPGFGAYVGELDYREIAPNGSVATAGVFDSAINNVVTVQAYAVSIRGPATRPPLPTSGGGDYFYSGGVVAPTH